MSDIAAAQGHPTDTAAVHLLILLHGGMQTVQVHVHARFGGLLNYGVWWVPCRPLPRGVVAWVLVWWA